MAVSLTGVTGLASQDGLTFIANFVWDPSTLAWIKSTGSTAGASEVSVTNFPATQAVSIASTVVTTNLFYVTIIDEVSATVTYIGWALPGTATSAAGWRVMRLTASGTQTIPAMADGDSLLNNVWDDRAALAYS